MSLRRHTRTQRFRVLRDQASNASYESDRSGRAEQVDRSQRPDLATRAGLLTAAISARPSGDICERRTLRSSFARGTRERAGDFHERLDLPRVHVLAVERDVPPPRDHEARAGRRVVEYRLGSARRVPVDPPRASTTRTPSHPATARMMTSRSFVAPGMTVIRRTVVSHRCAVRRTGLDSTRRLLRC